MFPITTLSKDFLAEILAIRIVWKQVLTSLRSRRGCPAPKWFDASKPGDTVNYRKNVLWPFVYNHYESCQSKRMANKREQCSLILMIINKHTLD